MISFIPLNVLRCRASSHALPLIACAQGLVPWRVERNNAWSDCVIESATVLPYSASRRKTLAADSEPCAATRSLKRMYRGAVPHCAAPGHPGGMCDSARSWTVTHATVGKRSAFAQSGIHRHTELRALLRKVQSAPIRCPVWLARPCC